MATKKQTLTGNGRIFKQSESALQQSCVRWFDFQYPEYRLNLFAIPNEGQRTPRNGARMKAQGRRAGVADMFLAYNVGTPKCGFFIEFKTDKGKQSEHQSEFEAAVVKQLYDYKIIRSFEEFETFINNTIE